MEIINFKNLPLKMCNDDTTMTNEIKEAIKFACYRNSKLPACSWSNQKNHTNNINLNKNNYGIICGDINNLWVLDIDKKNDGIIKFDEYLKEFGEINTFTQNTPNNGVHYYFKKTHSNTILNEIINTKLKQTQNISGFGIDIRDNGGYIMGPNCSINNKKYEVTKSIKMCEIPESLIYWLLPLIKDKKQINNSIIKQGKTIHNTANYKYCISDDKIKEIFNKMDKSFYEELKSWSIFTSICKSLNKIDIWDEYSKKTTKGNYNYTDNIMKWNDNNLDIDINLLCSIYKFDKITKLKYMKFDKIKIKIKKIEINEKYLNLDIETFEKYDKIIIKSCTATGKTTNISKNLNELLKKRDEYYDNLKILSIVDRISLAEQQIKTFAKNEIKLLNYQTANEYDILNYNSVICINSLIKLKDIEPEQFNNTIIYIDEIFSLMETLTHSDALNDNLVLISDILNKIIKNCYKIIVSDATITNNILTLLKKKITDKEIFIENKFKRFENTKAYTVNDENEFYELLIKETKEGNNFSVACDTLKASEKLYIKLCDPLINIKKLNIVLINKKTKLKFNDIKDPENTIIIYSPSIHTGVDINLKKQTTQYIHITGLSVNAISLYQMATRTRNQSKLIYCSIVGEKEAKYNTLKECREYFINIKNTNNKILATSSSINKDEERVIIDTSFFQMYTFNEYLNDVLNTNITLHFENCLIDAGYEIIKNKENKIIKLDKQINKELKNKIKDTDETQFNYDIEHFNELNKDENELKKRCDILGISNVEEVMKFKNIVIDDKKMNGFFNVQKIMKSDKYLLELNNKNTQNNFDEKINKDTTTKILLLRKFEQKIKIEKLDIQMASLNIDKIENFNEFELKHYQNIFRTTKTELKTKAQLQKFYIGLIKNITKEINIITTKKLKTKETNNKEIVIYSFNNDIINNCFELIKLKDENLINYDDTILKMLNIIKPKPKAKITKTNKIYDDDEYNF